MRVRRAANQVPAGPGAGSPPRGLGSAWLERGPSGRVTAIAMVIPVPRSKKNNKALLRRGRAVRIGWSKQIKRQERAIAIIAASVLGGCEPLFGADDVELLAEHDVQSDTVQVRVRRVGPPRRVGGRAAGRTGRRRDVPNLLESICDALNGVVYGDDRQIVRCTAARIVRTP